ncbi:MAG: Gfo/Idh/MocA family oxidoreductase [Gammaproteobacteria bacterium]|nr:Gfo/Idh/MocA family oxidoreductase [Gammaproteobacteria bacterium]
MQLFNKSNLTKLIRFAHIYGVKRTLYKVGGRLRLGTRIPFSAWRKKKSVGVIGCGQFAYATIGYVLSGVRDGGVAACYDINRQAAESFATTYCVPTVAHDVAEVFDNPAVKLIYVASNHATHAEYAAQALERGHVVYCEKPVAVTVPQLARLHQVASKQDVRIYAGYNRIFSQAVTLLKDEMVNTGQPLTLSCFVSGHKLPEDHWYRDAGEGTRICGNVGHWLDLSVHILSWGTLPDKWRIQLSWSDPAIRYEDVAITMTSSRGDLVNIVLTVRTDPFEGVNETINFQQGDVIAKIDDFRRMTLWKGEKLINRRFRPKDVGHEAAILQPFTGRTRDWKEVELSTLLMLHITRMVEEANPMSTFSFSDALKALETEQT